MGGKRPVATLWTAARQASPSITNSWKLLKLMSITSVIPSNHLILCHIFLLLPSVFPSIRVFSNLIGQYWPLGSMLQFLECVWACCQAVQNNVLWRSLVCEDRVCILGVTCIQGFWELDRLFGLGLVFMRPHFHGASHEASKESGKEPIPSPLDASPVPAAPPPPAAILHCIPGSISVLGCNLSGPENHVRPPFLYRPTQAPVILLLCGH